MAGYGVALAFLGALGFFAEALGYLARPLNTLLGLLLLIAFLSQYPPREVGRGLRKQWPAWVVAVAAAIGIFCTAGWGRVLLVSLLLGAIRWLRSGEERGAAELRVFQTTAFAFGAFLWFWRETAAGWYALEGAARGLGWVARHIGWEASLGPTAAGLPVIVLLLIFNAATLASTPGPRRRRVLTVCASLLALQFIFLAIYLAAEAALSVNLLLRQGEGGGRSWHPFAFLQYLYPNNLPSIMLLLGAIAIITVTRRWGPPLDADRPAASRRWALAAGALTLFLGAALFGLVPPRPAARGEVLLHDAGYLRWDMPVFGSYGDKGTGMFGRLPQYLRASGYQVKLGPVSRQALESADVLVVINLNEKFDGATKRAIWEFVRRGGGLLLLGDHTGLQGIREPSNELLEPAHIGLNFDSVKPFRDGWPWAYDLRRHAATQGVSGAISQPGIWIGASLALAPPARPVVIGSYGFSDPGNPANRRDGYLGNLRYDPGERLGDVPLVAECRYGKGTVLVFGDTSSFQNGALVYSHRFVDNIFAWLASRHAAPVTAMHLWGGALLLLVGVLLFVRFAQTGPWLTVAAAAFLLGWASGTIPARALEAPSATDPSIAWIDVSHLERCSLNPWIDDGVGGLANNLMRNGYSPLFLTRWDPRELQRGELLIVIGPSQPFSPAEVAAVHQFVQEGGHVILSAGWEDAAGSAALWADFGLRVEQTPLGRVLVNQKGGDIRLYRGWSVGVLQGKPEVLCSPWGYPAIVRLSIGKGSVVAIADTSFLLNRNLEGTQTFYPENIDFLGRLLRPLRREPDEEARAGAPAPSASSPPGRQRARAAQGGGR